MIAAAQAMLVCVVEQVAAERMSAIRIVRLYAAEGREKERYGWVEHGASSRAQLAGNALLPCLT